MKRLRDDWYLGTADAVFQNSEAVAAEGCEFSLILSGDQIYKMNYREMLAWHEDNHADVTIATIEVSPQEAHRFGICEIDRIIASSDSKRSRGTGRPRPLVFNPEKVSASMGIYIFNTDVLLRTLLEDSEDHASSHDFGHDVIPKLMSRARVIAYNFADMNAKEELYWRDVGTIDAYYEANMDLVSVSPEFNLYDERWPVRTGMTQQPPAKFVFAQEGRRMGVALDSIVCAGCIISGGRVVRSVLSPGRARQQLLRSGVFDSDAQCGDRPLQPHPPRHHRLGHTIPESSSIGFDVEADRAAGYTVTESGIVVVPVAGIWTGSDMLWRRVHVRFSVGKDNQ